MKKHSFPNENLHQTFQKHLKTNKIIWHLTGNNQGPMQNKGKPNDLHQETQGRRFTLGH